MPCNDELSGYVIDHKTGGYIKQAKYMEMLQAELSNRTRMLCNILKTIEKITIIEAIFNQLPEMERNEIKSWWYTHKESDKQRKGIK